MVLYLENEMHFFYIQALKVKLDNFFACASLAQKKLDWEMLLHIYDTTGDMLAYPSALIS